MHYILFRQCRSGSTSTAFTSHPSSTRQAG